MIFGFRTFELHNLFSLVDIDMLCSTDFSSPSSTLLQIEADGMAAEIRFLDLV
jgi:hypothetical protein